MGNLSLHVHDDDRVGAVTDDKLFNITRKWVDAMHSDVGACKTTERLERVQALCTLYVPHLYCTVGTCTGMSQLHITTQLATYVC